MKGLARTNLDLIIIELSKKYGVSQAELSSMINSVFRFFLVKFTDMNDGDTINMPKLGRFYAGQVAKRNKARWLLINELLEQALKKENINYE